MQHRIIVRLVTYESESTRKETVLALFEVLPRHVPEETAEMKHPASWPRFGTRVTSGLRARNTSHSAGTFGHVNAELLI
jgi:hypothetical protein